MVPIVTDLQIYLEFTEALSSDEDEVDENNTSYLDSIKNFATKKANQSGLEMSAEIKVNNQMKMVTTIGFINSLSFCMCTG